MSNEQPNWPSDKNKRRRPRVTIPFKRLPGELQIEHSRQVVRCRVLLTDISPSGVGIFIENAVDIGSRVTLVLEQPKHLFLKGEIMWCSLFNLHPHVITAEHFKYRAGMHFTFDSPTAEREFQEFCATIFKPQAY